MKPGQHSNRIFTWYNITHSARSYAVEKALLHKKRNNILQYLGHGGCTVRNVALSSVTRGLRHGDQMTKRFTVAKIIIRFEERVNPRSPLNLCQRRNANCNYNTVWWRRFKRASKRQTQWTSFMSYHENVSQCNSGAMCTRSLRFNNTFTFIHRKYNHSVITPIVLATKRQIIKIFSLYFGMHIYIAQKMFHIQFIVKLRRLVFYVMSRSFLQGGVFLRKNGILL